MSQLGKQQGSILVADAYSEGHLIGEVAVYESEVGSTSNVEQGGVGRATTTLYWTRISRLDGPLEYFSRRVVDPGNVAAFSRDLSAGSIEIEGWDLILKWTTAAQSETILQMYPLENG